VRIAAHRSTIAAQTTATNASAKSAGASFFDILAGASSQPANRFASRPVNAASQKDADAAKENDPSCKGGNDVSTRKSSENASLHNAVPPITPKATTAHSQTQHAAATSDGNGTHRTAGRNEKTQAPAPAFTRDVVGFAPIAAQIAVVSSPPVPSPTSSVAANNVPSSTPGIASDATQTTATDAISTAELQPAVGQDQSVAQNAQATVQSLDSTVAPATQPESATDSTVQPGHQGQTSGSHRLSAQDAKVAVGIFDPPQNGDTQNPNTPSAPAAGSTASPQAQQAASAVALTLNNMPSPDVNVVSDTNSAPQASSGTRNGKPGNASQSKTTAPANAAISTPAESPAATTGTSSHAAQNNTQSNAQNSSAGQHAQNQPTQIQPAPQSTSNPASAATQTQAIAAHGAQQEGFASHLSTNATDVARSGEQVAQPDVKDTLPTQGINTANVIQKMSETEMRVGMRSAEFGEISIRTSVSQQQMVTQISVDHGDLGKAISAHIPTIEAKLGGELGLRATVQVSESGMSFSGERNSSSPQREQQTFVQPAALESMEPMAEAYSVLPHVQAATGDAYRLDIRA